MGRAALLCLALLAPAGAGAQAPAQAPEPAAAAKAPQPAQKKKAKTPKVYKDLPWAQLGAEHQRILAPLKADWESIDPERKHKWVGIAKRYPKMKPKSQERVQHRMQAWAKLTPEQRQQAREGYRRIAKKTPPGKRKNLSQQWADYQALSQEEGESDEEQTESTSGNQQ